VPLPKYLGTPEPLCVTTTAVRTVALPLCLLTCTFALRKHSAAFEMVEPVRTRQRVREHRLVAPCPVLEEDHKRASSSTSVCGRADKGKGRPGAAQGHPVDRGRAPTVPAGPAKVRQGRLAQHLAQLCHLAHAHPGARRPPPAIARHLYQVCFYLKNVVKAGCSPTPLTSTLAGRASI